MKRLLVILAALLVTELRAANPNPPLIASPLGRSLVRQTTQAGMQTVIGVSGGGTPTTNNATLLSGYLVGGNGGRGVTNVGVGGGLTLVSGVLSAPAIANPTTNYLKVWNIRDYGATGQNIINDSAALELVKSNWFKFGGVLYLPSLSPGEYWFTNQLSFPTRATNTYGQLHTDWQIRGDGMGISGAKLWITNGVWLNCPGNMPDFHDLYLIGANITGTNCAVKVSSGAYMPLVERCMFYGFTNSTVLDIHGTMGTRVLDCDFMFNAIGVRLRAYSDGSTVRVRGQGNSIAPVVVGGYSPAVYPGVEQVNNAMVHVDGTGNGYNAIVSGNGKGTVVSGYCESPTYGAIAFGYPESLFPGETNYSIRFGEVRDFVFGAGSVNKPMVNLHTTVEYLRLQNSEAWLAVSNFTAACGLSKSANSRFTGSLVWPTNDLVIPAIGGREQNLNVGHELWRYDGSSTNLTLQLDDDGTITFAGGSTVNGASDGFNIATNAISPRWLVPTNFTATRHTPVAGYVSLVASNHDFYTVSQLKTNLWSADDELWVNLREDFAGGGTTDNTMGTHGWRGASGGNGAQSYADSAGAHPWVLQTTSGAVSNNADGVVLNPQGSTTHYLSLDNGPWEATWIVMPTQTNACDFGAGLQQAHVSQFWKVSSLGGLDFNYGFFGVAFTNGSNWYLLKRETGGTQVWVDTGVRPAPNTWAKFKLRGDSLNVWASVNGGAEVTTTAQLTTVVPMAAIITGEAVDKSVKLDFFQFKQRVVR